MTGLKVYTLNIDLFYYFTQLLIRMTGLNVYKHIFFIHIYTLNIDLFIILIKMITLLVK